MIWKCHVIIYAYYVFRYRCQYFFSEELQNLQRTNEEQNEKISECERQILENEGRILLGKKKGCKISILIYKKIDNIKNQ